MYFVSILRSVFGADDAGGCGGHVEMVFTQRCCRFIAFPVVLEFGPGERSFKPTQRPHTPTFARTDTPCNGLSHWRPRPLFTMELESVPTRGSLLQVAAMPPWAIHYAHCYLRSSASFITGVASGSLGATLNPGLISESAQLNAWHRVYRIRSLRVGEQGARKIRQRLTRGPRRRGRPPR